MDFNGIVSNNDSTALIHQQLMMTLRHDLWCHQQRLKENPDPTDEWWFLVDPNLPEPTMSDWQTGT